jgi:hypothetical protein
MISLNVTRLPCVCTVVDDEIVPNEDCISGPDIQDSMIETELVGLARATAEINENESNRMKVTGNMPFTEFIEPGSFVMFSDLERGDFQSLVEKSSLSIRKSMRGNYTADLNIQLEREEI